MAIGSIPTGINATAQYLQQAQGTGQAAEAAKITANAQNRRAETEQTAKTGPQPLAPQGMPGANFHVTA